MRLEAWIKKENKYITKWLESIKLTYNTYKRILAGKDIPLSTALIIERATKGEVTVYDMEPVAYKRYLARKAGVIRARDESIHVKPVVLEMEEKQIAEISKIFSCD